MNVSNYVDCDERLVDLRNYPVVLGSGPSAIATIHGLLKNCDKVYVVDASITHDNFQNVNQTHKMNRSSSPKFNNPKNSYIYKSFDQKYQITTQNFHPTGSLAKGGLSNLWGGGMLPYNRKDIEEFPYSWDRIKKVYKDVFNILKSTPIPRTLLESLDRKTQPENKTISSTISDTIIAFNTKHKADEACQLSSCQFGCVGCNRGIFNAGLELDLLIKKNKVSYIPNVFIERIERIDGNYLIKGVSTLNGQKKECLAKFVFCSLGVLSTSKIVMEMINQNVTLPLLNTPAGQFIAFSFGKKDNMAKSSIMSGKTFVLGKSDEAVANLFPITKNLLEVMIGNTLAKILFGMLGKMLLSHFLVGNIYFSSKYSQNSLWLENSEIYIKGELSDELKEKYLNSLSLLEDNLRKERIFKIPFLHKLLKPGQDIHYGGTLPMKLSPTVLQCDINGRLHGEKNFYIADPSGLPMLPAKPHTFNAMAQSYMIGEQFQSLRE